MYYTPEIRQLERKIARYDRKIKRAWQWFYVALSIAVGWGLFWILYALIKLNTGH